MDIDKRLITLIRDHQEILAIKEYREYSGAGLKEAKEYIDLLKARSVNSANSGDNNAEFTPPADLDIRIRQLLNEGKKIQAVKEYRESMGVDLREAKAYVDQVDGGEYSMGFRGAQSPSTASSGGKSGNKGLNLEPQPSRSPAAGILTAIIVIVLILGIWFFLR